MFSRQITALSTIGPMARVSPASVMTLIVLPVAYRHMIATSTESGSVIPAIAVIFHWPRNSRITSTQNAPPVTPSCTRPLIAWRTKTDWSITTFRLMFGRETRSAMSSDGALQRIDHASSVLAPSWRKTGM